MAVRPDEIIVHEVIERVIQISDILVMGKLRAESPDKRWKDGRTGITTKRMPEIPIVVEESTQDIIEMVGRQVLGYREP